MNSLSAMLAGRDRVNLSITGKHPGSGFAPYTFRDELTHGAAVWPHMGNGTGPPDIVLASAGRRQRRDAPASNTISAAAVELEGFLDAVRRIGGFPSGDRPSPRRRLTRATGFGRSQVVVDVKGAARCLVRGTRVVVVTVASRDRIRAGGLREPVYGGWVAVVRGLPVREPGTGVGPPAPGGREHGPGPLPACAVVVCQVVRVRP
ncbi:hypothetical protein ACIRL2_50190 [Embleya sp. NPDC127516]|uniref:hypothetical protein n=1 Tax=Embleya sp. NPDC127516 TaxID=3363990 RepID=UPI0038253580